MSDRIATRRQFLKGLGMVTGAFATGAFALKSSANEEGVAYNETPSGLPCFIAIQWNVSELKSKTEGRYINGQYVYVTVYYYIFDLDYLIRGVSGNSGEYITGSYLTKAEADNNLAEQKLLLVANLKRVYGC